ncbi:calreticulin-like [Pelodytes ibericus]
MMLILLLTAMLLAVYAEPIIYFQDQFVDEDGWQNRWVQSKNKSDYGKFQLSAGTFFGDPEKDKGLQTTQNWKFYELSARFEPFSNEGQTLVIQFTVKHEQGIDCGGGYVKIFPADLNQEQMNKDSEYYIMFGPDICGTIHEKVHVIFNYKGKHHLNKKDIKCKHDQLTHLYTLIIRSNNTYEVKIDNEKVENGTLEEDWDFLLPRKIVDLNATKPLDWDEREKIEDPNERRPDDWEEIEFIPDPDSRMPHDWDSSMDGEWEAPMIPNPKYRGIWQPHIIDNPNYKGIWVQPDKDNPDYVPDPNIYKYDNIGVIGLDLWQVKSGTIFDNFLITNNETFAEILGNETWGLTKDPERKMKEQQDEERDAKDEQKKRWKKYEREFARLQEMEKDKTLDGEKGRKEFKKMIARLTSKDDEEEPKQIDETKPEEKVSQIIEGGEKQEKEDKPEVTEKQEKEDKPEVTEKQEGEVKKDRELKQEEGEKVEGEEKREEEEKELDRQIELDENEKWVFETKDEL